MGKNMKGELMLILAAMIWGAAFVAQSVGMDYVGPFTFQAARCLLGALVLLPVIAGFSRARPKETAQTRKTLWTGGALCGLILFAATSLQQFGLLYTTAGKSGFITALYVVLVPVLGIFLHHRTRLNTWISVAIAAAALYLLCINGSFTVGRGELLTLGCALCFSFQILAVDHYSPHVNGVKLACIQFLVCGFLSLLAMALTESPSWAAVARCWLPIAYAGILSCGVAYTLQILGQRVTSPAVASLLMSLESAFAVLFGWLLLRERLSVKEYFGCALMFGAIVLAQLPGKKRTGPGPA